MLSNFFFFSLYLPDYQQGWTSCCMWFSFRKLPVPIYYPVILVGWVFFFLLFCRDSLDIREINHLSTFMLQIFLPRLSFVF